jgi:hypothetical protein
MPSHFRRPVIRRLVAAWVALCLLMAPLLAERLMAMPTPSDAMARAALEAVCTTAPDGSRPGAPQAPAHHALCLDLCASSCVGAPAPAPVAGLTPPAARAITVRVAVRPDADSAPSTTLPFTRGPPSTS